VNLPGWVAVREPRGRLERLSKKTLQSVPPWRAPHPLVASVSRHTQDHARGFACSISGPAAPMRRLWLQSSAYHATGRPRAGSRLVCTFYFFHRRPRRADAQRDSPLRRRSRTRAAAITSYHTPCARAPPPQGASAKEPVTICQGRPENALRFRLGTRVPSRKRNAAAVRAVGKSSRALLPMPLVVEARVRTPCGWWQ